jgi:glutamine synthetase
MARTMIFPVAFEYQRELAGTILEVKDCGTSCPETTELLKELCKRTEEALKNAKKLSSAIDSGKTDKMINGMNELRESVDGLEEIVPDDIWPFPTYAEMLFEM